MYKVEHHGSSGRWYGSDDEFATMAAALKEAARINNEGYGVQILRADGSVAMSTKGQRFNWGADLAGKDDILARMAVIESFSSKIPYRCTISNLLNLLGNSGKTSEKAINVARQAAEWLAAGALSKYSNQDFDISSSLSQSLQFDS